MLSFPHNFEKKNIRQAKQNLMEFMNLMIQWHYWMNQCFFMNLLNAWFKDKYIFTAPFRHLKKMHTQELIYVI